MAQNVLVIGGSRHIGYHAALRFLDAGSTVTFLLRNPSTFDNDEAVQKYVKSGKARLVKGDGLVEDDIRNVWSEASKEKPVDVLLFTVGFTGSPKFHLLKGMTISPNNLVTQCYLNTLCLMPTPSIDAPYPKVITLSSVGAPPTSRAHAPLPMKFLYGYLIAHPLKDKLGFERVTAHCAGWDWNATDGEPSEDIMGQGWKEREGLPPPGSLKDAMVIRAAALTDGECKGDSAKEGSKPPYRVGGSDIGGWTISRKDVAHFIFDAVTNNWEKYGNQRVDIAY